MYLGRTARVICERMASRMFGLSLEQLPEYRDRASNMPWSNVTMGILQNFRQPANTLCPWEELMAGVPLCVLRMLAFLASVEELSMTVTDWDSHGDFIINLCSRWGMKDIPDEADVWGFN